jgi:hypothetical protein
MADLNLSLGEPDAIRESIRKLERAAEAAILEANQHEADAARHMNARERKRREYEAHRAMIAAFQAHLRLATGEHSNGHSEAADVGRGDAAGLGRATAVVRVHAVVESAGRPVRIADVHPNVPELAVKTVGWALWKLAKARKIRRVGHGVYAALAYEPDELALDSPVDSGEEPRPGGRAVRR